MSQEATQKYRMYVLVATVEQLVLNGVWFENRLLDGTRKVYLMFRKIEICIQENNNS